MVSDRKLGKRMGRVNETRNIALFMNPDELRRVADEMEREFPKRGPGESNAIALVAFCGGNTEVWIHADQDWFTDKERNRLPA